MKKAINIPSGMPMSGPDNKAKKHKKANTFLMAGIGASAGGLEALKVFFDHTPIDSGIAFIIIQHLDPLHKSLLSELIGGHTEMKVSEIENNTIVNPNNVYVIPPNKDLTIKNGCLHLTKPKELRNVRRTIDSFFTSLATDQKENAIGIVLSGTGTEGTLGLEAIKAAGGYTIIQEPETAQFDGMPLNAIMAKVGDIILPPEKMPAFILNHFAKEKRIQNNHKQESTSPSKEELHEIIQIIRNQTGYDFSNYKTNTIVRRILKRLTLNRTDTIRAYIKLLHNNTNETDKLYKDFFIGVTSFFRDKQVFNCIEKKTIPHLLQNCIDKKELRVWVCGCSTGEEAYSLAILLREALEKNKQFIKVIIFASDIDKQAIEFARNGVYSEAAIANLSSARVSRDFTRRESGYQLKKEIREMVVFAHHNLIKDPPFSKIDMITCRNLLIYLNSDLQKKIIPLFHYSLNKDGILILGTSESIGDYNDYFSVFDAKTKIFKKNQDLPPRKTNSAFALPFTNLSPVPSISNMPHEIKQKINIAGLTEKILLNQYAPPTVMVDKYNNAIYFSGNTGLYFEPSKGEASLNILEMAKFGLKAILDSAIHEARSKRTEITVKNVDVNINDHFRTINLIIKPILTKDIDLGALIIIFESIEKPLPEKKGRKVSAKTINTRELENELRITREHLQTAINELETSNIDLQTSNEEYQSSNEELQSSNEELETSREELQSVNEELITVNSELSEKIEQLSEANDDLTNLLSSIEVATIFLDRDLKIKRFTPTATKLFNLIPSDIDRPMTHLTSNIVYETFADDIKHVLRTLMVRTADIITTDSTWYHMRILPYRTSENVIEGVLVTFVDITEQKLVEENLKKTNEHLNLVIENLPVVPFSCTMDPELHFSFIGKGCENLTGFLPEQFIHKSSFWTNRVHPDDKKKIMTAFSALRKKGKMEINFRWKCSNGKYKTFTNFMKYAAAEDKRPAYIVGIWQETSKTTPSTIL